MSYMQHMRCHSASSVSIMGWNANVEQRKARRFDLKFRTKTLSRIPLPRACGVKGQEQSTPRIHHSINVHTVLHNEASLFFNRNNMFLVTVHASYCNRWSGSFLSSFIQPFLFPSLSLSVHVWELRSHVRMCLLSFYDQLINSLFMQLPFL